MQFPAKLHAEAGISRVVRQNVSDQSDVGTSWNQLESVGISWNPDETAATYLLQMLLQLCRRRFQ